MIFSEEIVSNGICEAEFVGGGFSEGALGFAERAGRSLGWECKSVLTKNCLITYIV